MIGRRGEAEGGRRSGITGLKNTSLRFLTRFKSLETLLLENQNLAHCSHADYIFAGSTPWSTGQGEATPVGTRRYLSHQMPDTMILTTALS